MGVCGNHWKRLQPRSCKIWCKSIRKTAISCLFFFLKCWKKALLGLLALRALTVGPFHPSEWSRIIHHPRIKRWYKWINTYIYIYSGNVGKATANKQNQKAQDASRQVAKKFGCCKYSANCVCVLFLESLELSVGKPANEGADTSFCVCR